MKINRNLQTCSLGEFSEITCFISSKPFTLRGPNASGEGRHISEMNIQTISRHFSLNRNEIIMLHQVHGSQVVDINPENLGKIYSADAAITQMKGVMLLILASDCVPILLYDTDKKVIGVVHAGWRGLDTGIISKTLQKMKLKSGCITKNIVTYIGPCISQKNYEVGYEVAQKFIPNFSDFVSRQKYFGERYLLNIGGIARQQLINNGILESNIEISGYCTYQDKELFHSYRRSTKTGEIYMGNNALGIMLK